MSGPKRILYICLGFFFVALGALGTVVPLLPTTVFLLLAAYFFARSDERALNWLLTNRVLGEYIRNYRDGRGMTLFHKVFTISLLWASILGSIIFLVDNNSVRLLLAVIASGVTIHLVSLPTCCPEGAPPHKPERAGEAD